MKERDITAKVLKSMRDDPRFGSCLVEVKIVHGRTLNGKALKEHQYRALRIAYEGSMYFKIPDVGYQNPCDAFIMKRSESYLVIYFDTKPPVAYAIPINKITEGRSVKLSEAIEWGLPIKLLR